MKRRKKMFRSKRIIPISIPDDISEKELRKMLMAVFKAVAAASETLWTDEMQALWKQRERAKGISEESMEDAMEIEDRWYLQHFGTYTPKSEQQEERLEDLFQTWFKYLPKILELPEEQRSMIVGRMRQELEAYRKTELIIRCDGDPDEIVWRGLTRAHLMDVFKKEKDRVYTVGDVASELNISYNQAYNRIVPFLKKQGVKVK